MSGIYIPDWGKPEICTDCPCFNEYTQCCQVDIMADIDNCHLIPVPDHGRLVDADALENFIKKDWDEDDHWIADVVYSRPTIIPADKEEAKKSDSEDLVHDERADRHSRAGRGGDPGNLCMLRGQQPRGGIQ